MGDVFLELDNVSKTIGKQVIVHPVTLRLGQGKTLALCGGNGAGKSTLLRMIAGILQPTTGTIRAGGLVWKRQRKAYAEQLGYMPDDFQFGSSLSAWETIAFYASLRGVGKERAKEVLELVDLFAVRQKPVSAFSKGMRQRLMFAQAILAKPRLLLLDEPTNGLDPFWTDMFVQLANDIKAEGTTIVFSTHHLQVAEATADEALFLHQGVIMSRGTIRSYKEQYGEAGLNGVFAEWTARSQGGHTA